MSVKERLKEYLASNGADAVGFAPVERFTGAPGESKPQNLLPGAATVISIAVRIPRGVVESKNKRAITNAWNAANSELNSLAYRVVKMLEDRGYLSMWFSPFLPIDIKGRKGLAGDISHKHAAEQAGIGYIGASNLLITPEFGPRVRLISIITRASLEPDPLLEENFCLDCSEKYCVKACPVGAVRPGGKFLKLECLDEYQAYGGRKLAGFIQELIKKEEVESKLDMLKYPEILEFLEMHQFIRVGGVNCWECMRVCPVGKEG